jgi:orotate phosphoribosyltransferase
MTAGTSARESFEILRAACPRGVDVRAVIISVDRMERGTGEKSALAEVSEQFGVKTFAIVTLNDIVEHLATHPLDGKRVIDDEMLSRIKAYREQYGAIFL